jgi:hypothetical protein
MINKNIAVLAFAVAVCFFAQRDTYRYGGMTRMMRTPNDQTYGSDH